VPGDQRGRIRGRIQRRYAVSPAHAATQGQPIIEQGLHVLEIEGIDVFVLVVIGRGELCDRSRSEPEGGAVRTQPVAFRVPAEQQLVAVPQLDPGLQARTDDIEIALVAVERRPRDDGRAQRGRIVEIVDVIHAVGLEEPAEGSARNVAAVAEIEGAVETVVSREQVRAGAAKAGVVYPVCADIEIEAAVLIDLIAERRRRRLSFPGGVTLATATADVKIIALS